MLDTYIKNRGMAKTIIHKNNHNTINETNWDVDYDGSIANVSLDLSKNGKNKHLDFKLTNDDLANILTIPSVSQPIHKRLKMDFKKPDSFKQIFLEVHPESSSDSLDLQNMDTIFSNELLDNHLLDNDKKSSPIQELLTHISSPMTNEEFVMPFQDNSLQDLNPVIKILHTPRSSHRRSKKSKRTSHKFSKRANNYKFNSHTTKHHNYPSTRKSPRTRNSRRS